jgi:dehydrogenase/reductase SDR family member 7B
LALCGEVPIFTNMHSDDVNHKTIWITGASSGIGEALVHAFSKKNANIILSARNSEALENMMQGLSYPKEKYLVLPFDLKSNFDAGAMVDSILKKFNTIDILINNGGQSQRSESLSTSEVIEQELMQINYFAQVKLAKAVLPMMIKNKTGHIVVISSIAGKFGFYLRSTYSAAKHALHGYFESLRLENEKLGIKVLIVCPGKIKTNISINASLENGQKHNQMDESHIHAMSAEDCAKKIIKGIANNSEEILIGGKEILTVYLKRFFPRLLAKILRKQSPY